MLQNFTKLSSISSCPPDDTPIDYFFVPDKFIRDIILFKPELTSVELGGKLIKADTLDKLFEVMLGLEVLVIRQCSALNDSHIALMRRNLKKLKCIGLFGNYNVTKQAVYLLQKAFPP